MSAPSYQGYYINLDRSPDRRSTMERQLDAIGISNAYQRFTAVDGLSLAPRRSRLPPGEVGVFASHLALIEMAAEQDRPVHILEDDAILSRTAPKAIEALVRRGLLKQYDIILTEMMVSPNLAAIRALKEKFDKALEMASGGVPRLDVIDLANVHFGGATSYILTPESAKRMLPRFRSEWAAGPNEPIDLFMRRETHRGRIKMACAFPFVTSVAMDSIAASTTGRPNEDLFSSAVMMLLRYCFFIGGDLEGEARKLMSSIRTAADRRGGDARRDFLADVLGLVLSDEFHLP